MSFSFSCNRDWRISSSESWIRLSPSSGTGSDEAIKVTITCDANTTYDERKCTFSIVAEELNETISVTQTQNKGIVLTSDKTLTVESGAGEYAIEYKTNDLISVMINDDAKEWVKVIFGPSTKSLHDEYVIIKVYPNDLYEWRSTLIELVTAESKSEMIRLNQKGKDPIDLSSAETANCYIVPLTNDKYCFNASVRGNSEEAIRDGSKASIIWQYESMDSGTQTIVKNVSYDKEKGVISFYPSGRPGNALVALRDDAGSILWSWHLWCFDYDEENGFHTINGYKLMDRNLGAIDRIEAGFAYQWGRKDPFPFFYTDSEIDRTTCSSSEIGSIDYAAAHPTTVIFNGYASYGPNGGWHWISKENYSVLWGSGKTSNDPCPPGWKVISNGYMVMRNIPTGVFSKDEEGLVYFEEPYCVPKMLLPYQTLFSENGSTRSELPGGLTTWTARTYADGELGEVLCVRDGFWFYPYDASGNAASRGQNVRCQRIN